jgi:predicted permease
MSNKRRKRKRQAHKTVTVYLDGEVVVVPTVVDCHFAARGALGIPRGVGVICRSRDDAPPRFPTHGHTFREGEFYRDGVLREGEV